MGMLGDARTLFHLLTRSSKGTDHASRMESFYAGQADGYDDFRRRLLKGRQDLWDAIPTVNDGIWVDLGGGTGSNLDFFGDRISSFQRIYVVDLSKSLLDVARQRIHENAWSNVEIVEADATTFQPTEGQADIVTFSYSLTMIPDWFAAIENAKSFLKSDGRIGVVDFYVARKHAAESRNRHGWFTRVGWPAWFSYDNVFPSADHLPFLERHFRRETLLERRAKVPYLPLVRVPYYVFVGKKV